MHTILSVNEGKDQSIKSIGLLWYARIFGWSNICSSLATFLLQIGQKHKRTKIGKLYLAKKKRKIQLIMHGGQGNATFPESSWWVIVRLPI